MPRNLDGLNILRYVLGFPKFLEQAEEEEETVIEPDTDDEPEADDVCSHGVGFDEDCEWCDCDEELLREADAHQEWLEIQDYSKHVQG